MEKERLNINVNMSGKEYNNYKKENSFFKDEKTKRIAIILVLSLTALLFITYFIGFLMYGANDGMNGFESSFKKEGLSFGWDNLLKFFFIKYGHMCILLIIIAWMIHGVGFHIIKVR